MPTVEDWTSLEDRIAGGLVPRRGSQAMVRGEGLWLWNAAGERYLDLTSGHGVASLGHAHPALCRAIASQSKRLMVCSASFYNDRRGELLAVLSQVLPSHLEHAFLCNSGTEAMEAGLKFARLATGRSGFVALKRGFHGRTAGALSVTWNPKFRKPFQPLLEDVAFATPDDLENLDSLVTEDTAVVVVEIIQGEGGVYPCRAEFLQGAQRLCHERGALLLVDEIQTGCGRTGEWFAHQPFGLEPDLMALSKGIAGGFPLGVACYTQPVAEALFAGGHGSTFGGNPLACAAGRATLETLKEEDLPTEARLRGESLMDGLRQELSGRTVVREIRGRGLMVGIELREKVAPYLRRLMDEHHVLALPAGPTVLRLLPALVIDQEQVESAVRAVATVLR